MLAGLMFSTVAFSGKALLFPKLSPLSNTLRIHNTFSDKFTSDKPLALPTATQCGCACAGGGACAKCPLRAGPPAKMQAEVVASEQDLVEIASPVVVAEPSPADPTATAYPMAMAYPTEELNAMGGFGPETGFGIWDPLKLAGGADVDLKWYRQAEIKHGRVCMLACVGYVAAKAALVFPGTLSLDGTHFSDLVNTNPFVEWGSVPIGGQLQAFMAAAIIELQGEQTSIDGGKTGELPVLRAWLPWIPKGEAKDESTKARRAEGLLSELKNGRLAMIGIAGFYASESIPGSVPFHF